MTENDDELLEQTRRELLAAGVSPPDLTLPEGYDARAEASLVAILATARPRPASRRTWWRIGAVVAAAAVVVAIVIGMVRTGPTPVAQAGTPPLLSFHDVDPGTLPTTGTDAAGPLHDLAARARSLSGPGDGPVQHLVFDAWWASTGEEDGDTETQSAVVPLEHEIYLLPDGTYRSIERRGTPLDQQGRIDPEAGWAQGPAVTDESIRDASRPADLADTLPTDPAALSQRFAADDDPTTCADGGCLLDEALSVLGRYAVTPALTAALWEALADDDSVSYLGTTRDRLGRTAEAFMSPGLDRHSQRLLFIDPATGAYLGDETVLTSQSEAWSFTPPAVIEFNALVDVGRIPLADVPPTAAK